MAVTRLKRKERRNMAKANDRQAKIKQFTTKPVIKNVDIEAIKQEFAEKKAAKTAAETKAAKPAKAAAAEAAPKTEE
jgi:hypothetical protein